MAVLGESSLSQNEENRQERWSFGQRQTRGRDVPTLRGIRN